MAAAAEAALAQTQETQPDGSPETSLEESASATEAASEQPSESLEPLPAATSSEADATQPQPVGKPKAKAKAKAQAAPKTAAVKKKASKDKLAEAKAAARKSKAAQNKANFDKAVKSGSKQADVDQEKPPKKPEQQKAGQKTKPADSEQEKPAKKPRVAEKEKPSKKAKVVGAKKDDNEAESAADGAAAEDQKDAAPKTTKKLGKGDKEDPKPSSKQAKPKERVAALKSWATADNTLSDAEPDDAESQDDSSSAGPAKRDGSKKRFFRQRRSAGELPQNLLDLWDKAGRTEQTRLLDKLVVRKKGKLVLDFDNKYLRRRLQRYSETIGANKCKGVTETIAAARCGGVAQLKAAVATGEASVVNEGGCRYYVFKDYMCLHTSQRVRSRGPKERTCELLAAPALNVRLSQEISLTKLEAKRQENLLDQGTDVSSTPLVNDLFSQYVNNWELHLSAGDAEAAAASSAPDAAPPTLGDFEKGKLQECQAVLSTARNQAERVFLAVRSKSATALMLKEQLGRCVKQVLDTAAQLKQVELFGALPNQPPCNTAQLKALLLDAFQHVEALQEATQLCRTLAGGEKQAALGSEKQAGAS